jgi:ssDNA-binding Zn-finger/Zn-ribbon topoisomerase 1
MYEFLSLKLKCPKCGHSLMDKDQKVDNEPSIHLNVSCEGNEGKIWLSSIYGSYNFIADIELPKDVIAQFSCPHCHDEIPSMSECLTCGATMVYFYLDMGGKVSVCSRSGCKNHFVEFDDLSVALKRMYQEYGYAGKQQKRPADETKKAEAPKISEAEEIIESGTFLQTYCPYCSKSLIEEDMLKLKIADEDEEGILMLSPYLNVFSSKSTIYLSEEKAVKDLSCPHCDHSLIEHDVSCDRCGSSVAKIQVSARTKLIDFYLCTKKGCKWHGLSSKDLYDIRLEDSLEW